MNQPCHSHLAIAVPFCRLPAGKFLAVVLILLALLFAASVARADSDSDYLNIYALMLHADQQAADGDTSLAHTNYLIAQTDLLIFQQDNPVWYPRILAYRLQYLADKIAATAKPAVAVQTPATTAETRPAASAVRSLVKLLDAGSAPRTVLRLHPAVGDKMDMSMTMQTTMHMAASGQSVPAVNIPTVVVVLSAEVTGIATNGDIAYEMTFDDATVADDPSAQPMVMAAMKSSLASLKGLTATGRMSDQGLIKGIQMKLPASADPQLKKMMDQMKESFANASVPLPKEAVGPGAKWEYTTESKSQGMTIDQTANYQLMAVDGDRLTLHTAITQTAANQEIKNPAMPGITVDLKKLTGTGTSDSVLDLNHVLPQSASLTETMEMVTGVTLHHKQQIMDMSMTLNVALQAE